MSGCYLVVMVVVVARRGGRGAVGLRLGPLALRARLLEMLRRFNRLAMHACNENVHSYYIRKLCFYLIEQNIDLFRFMFFF